MLLIRIIRHVCTMFKTYMLVVFLQTIICSQSVSIQDNRVAIIIPWMGSVETDGAVMGSSFLIAMERLKYNVPFALMPLRCDERFLVIAQVRPIAVLFRFIQQHTVRLR